MRRPFFTPRCLFAIFALFSILLSACQPTAPEVPTASPTVLPSVAPSATATLTPTLDPSLPCGGATPERVYLFMDCADVRRIRAAYLADSSAFRINWNILKSKVDEYRVNFPSKYNPDASWDVLWWGGGNFMPRDMALLYLVTGKVEYARDVLRLLELVRANTPNHAALSGFDSPDGRGQEYAGGIMSHPQFGAVPIQSTLFSYLAIRDTDLLTDAQRADYDQFFKHQAELLMQAAVLRGNNTPLDGVSNRNVPFAANVAALTIARAFPDDPAMQALDARLWPTLEWQIGTWWEGDGGWGENTQGYGFAMLEALMLLAETSARNEGVDLYAQSYQGRTIGRMCRFFLESAVPEGSVPALNDTSQFFLDPGLFRLCGYRSGDPELYFAEAFYDSGRFRAFGTNSSTYQTPFHQVAWAGLGDSPPAAPSFTSVLLADTGAAILRGGWERDSAYALLQFTASRVHQEFSYGALYLFDHGPWLIGNGYHIPDAAPTDQHSTLSLDNRNQTFTGGEVAAFADLGQAGIAGVTSRPYSGFEHTRLLLWNKTFGEWIVVDDAKGDANPHTLQQRWYVWAVSTKQSENTWEFTHRGNAARLVIQMLPGLPAAYTKISRSYDWEVWIGDAVGVRMDVDYPGRPVRLVTSLFVHPKGEAAPVVRRVEDAGGTWVESQLGEAVWTWLLPPLDGKAVAGESPLLNGTAGCLVRVQGKLTGYCLLNGTELREQGQLLVAAPEPIYLEADFASGKVMIQSTGEGQVAFYWPAAVSAVSADGKPVSFRREDSLVTLPVNAGVHTLEIR